MSDFTLWFLHAFVTLDAFHQPVLWFRGWHNASLYFVYVTNALSGYVIIYSVGGFLLGRRQNGLSGKAI